ALVGPTMRLGPAVTAETADGLTSGADDGRGSRATNPETRGAGGAGARGSGLGHTPDLSAAGAGTPQPAPTPPSADVPEARDDDIVARQLREAAERERDPALREKLWREYRRYVGGS
ncbi:MAG: hypothetical protein RLW62_08780, partial [Gammaproteobacteria bacterium]